MTTVAYLLKHTDDPVNLMAELFNTVLEGENLTADRDLFLALETNDFTKAKEIYERVFQPFFANVADNKEAA